MCDDISEDNIVKIFENLDSTGDKSVDFKEFKVSVYFALSLKLP